MMSKVGRPVPGALVGDPYVVHLPPYMGVDPRTVSLGGGLRVDVLPVLGLLLTLQHQGPGLAGAEVSTHVR